MNVAYINPFLSLAKNIKLETSNVKVPKPKSLDHPKGFCTSAQAYGVAKLDGGSLKFHMVDIQEI